MIESVYAHDSAGFTVDRLFPDYKKLLKEHLLHEYVDLINRFLN